MERSRLGGLGNRDRNPGTAKEGSPGERSGQGAQAVLGRSSQNRNIEAGGTVPKVRAEGESPSSRTRGTAGPGREACAGEAFVNTAPRGGTTQGVRCRTGLRSRASVVLAAALGQPQCPAHGRYWMTSRKACTGRVPLACCGRGGGVWFSGQTLLRGDGWRRPAGRGRC